MISVIGGAMPSTNSQTLNVPKIVGFLIKPIYSPEDTIVGRSE